jgi:hypothetical protein
MGRPTANSVTPLEKWIRTDEAEDVAASVRHALRCLSFATTDVQAWKWFALSVHAALQGACVCHLTTTAVPLGAVEKKNAEEWLEYFEQRGSPEATQPCTRLMALPGLLKAVRRPNSAGDRSNAVGVTVSDEELAWLKRFHSGIRNEFVHFSPKGWAIEVSGLPSVGRLVARIIHDIASAGWAFRHKDRFWVAGLETELQRLTAACRGAEN